MTLAIDVRDLSKRFGTLEAVNHIAIQIEQGHITGFLGPNGSGKTTTLRMLCGLLTPDSGEGQVLGLDFPREAEAIKRQTGYMTQHFSLYDDLTIEENLTFIARVYSLDHVRRRVTDTLQKLGLAERRKQLAGQLSGGWKQRLALAAAVMHEPKLLLLDEPTAGVDPQARRDFWAEIHQFAEDGMTVLVSTHYMDEAERCHEIAYIFNGELIARGTAGDVIKQSRLVTFEAQGPRADRLAGDIADRPGVEMVAPFGAALHVSGTDRTSLEAAIEPFRHEPWHWTEVPASLEDVFIQLMRENGGQKAQMAA
ncbi:MAG TPA: ABC transporter ATP-binding protein [Sphingomicrobium sp.]|nr:ABC transporter ATP-binding protein [Sphingomicrobium sp.]